MGVRWAMFAVGLGLLLAPLFAGYASAGAIVRDVSAGTLACVTALAAVQWPRVRALNVLAALWLVHAARRNADGRAASVELAAGALLLAAALLARRRARSLPAPRVSEARGT